MKLRELVVLKPFPIWRGLPLWIFCIFSPSLALAQLQPEQEMLEQQCINADAPQPCRAAVPACMFLVEARRNEQRSLDRDRTLDRLWNQIGWCQEQLGEYAAAEAAFRNSLSLVRRVYGAEHQATARVLNNLAGVLVQQGLYLQAEAMLEQALEINKKRLGPKHPEVAHSMNNLAAVIGRRGQYGRAAALLEQSLGLSKKRLGPEHPQVASILSNLASALERQGQYVRAEMLFQQALDMRRKLLGPEHVDIADSLDMLACMLENQGQYARAEALFQQALDMCRKLRGPSHPKCAETLSGLAIVSVRKGQHTRAEGMFQEVLDLRRKALGPEHLLVATTLNNLAVILAEQDQYARAAALFQQVLDIKTKRLGIEHPNIADTLHSLAGVLARQEQYARAAALYQQALDLYKKFLGPQHPSVATSLNDLASVLLAQGQTGASAERFQQAARIDEALLRATTSEVRMRAMLLRLRGEENAMYSLLGDASVGPVARELALRTALLRKGRALDAGAAANLLLQRSTRSNPVVKQRFADWQALRQTRDGLIYGGIGALRPEDYRAQFNQLEQQAQGLETQLANDLPELSKLQPPHWDDILLRVAGKLKDKTALVEILWVEPFQALAKDPHSRWGTPRYYACLLFGDGRIESVDLGVAATIDEQSRALLRTLFTPVSNPLPAARALYERLLMPLLPKLAGITELYLSLDGMLSIVPFDTLHDGKDYLLGRWRFHYLTSGRDLLHEPSRRTSGKSLLLANPDFGSLNKIQTEQSPRNLYSRLSGLTPLPGTQQEAERLRPLLGVEPLVLSSATEEAVHQAHAPRILHIATHGLFLDNEDLPQPIELSHGLRNASFFDTDRSKLAPLASQLLLESTPGDSDAMYRSVLVLAGVLQGHRAKNTAQDGLLTAEEARSLDLEGTQLVTLSACESGQGIMYAGQGVYGLRRAFLVAGAETLVTSLWRVSDDATGELMSLYYGKLLDKKHPRERLGGMLEAMQELRQRPGRAHPYYWAPFLVIGQDGPLRP